MIVIIVIITIITIIIVIIVMPLVMLIIGVARDLVWELSTTKPQLSKVAQQPQRGVVPSHRHHSYRCLHHYYLTLCISVYFHFFVFLLWCVSVDLTF